MIYSVIVYDFCVMLYVFIYTSDGYIQMEEGSQKTPEEELKKKPDIFDLMMTMNLPFFQIQMYGSKRVTLLEPQKGIYCG